MQDTVAALCVTSECSGLSERNVKSRITLRGRTRYRVVYHVARAYTVQSCVSRCAGVHGTELRITLRGRTRYRVAYHIARAYTVQSCVSRRQVKESTLIDALTKKKTMAGGEAVVMNHNLADVRTSMNHAIISN